MALRLRAWRWLMRATSACFPSGLRGKVSFSISTMSMPAASLGFRAVPQPDPPVRDVDLQGTTGAVAQEAAGPVLGAEPADQRLHREGFCRGPLLGRVAPPCALPGGNMQARRLGPDHLGG